MHAGTEQCVGGRHFADLETEHAVDRLGPVEFVGVDIPVPSADAGEVLAAFEALDVAVLTNVLAFGEAVDDVAVLGQLPAQLALAADQHDDQNKHYRADGGAGPEQGHSGMAIMAS